MSLVNNSFIGNVSVFWGCHIKFYTLGSLSKIIYFLTVLGAGSLRSRFKQVSPEASGLALKTATFSLSSPGLPFAHPHLYVQTSSFKDASQNVLRPTQQPHFNLVSSFKALSPNVAHSKVLGLRDSTYALFRGRNSTHKRKLRKHSILIIK